MAAPPILPSLPLSLHAPLPPYLPPPPTFSLSLCTCFRLFFFSIPSCFPPFHYFCLRSPPPSFHAQCLPIATTPPSHFLVCLLCFYLFLLPLLLFTSLPSPLVCALWVLLVSSDLMRLWLRQDTFFHPLLIFFPDHQGKLILYFPLYHLYPLVFPCKVSLKIHYFPCTSFT